MGRDRLAIWLWHEPPRAVLYAVALGLVLAMGAVKALVPDLGAADPEVLLTIPVALAAFYGGLGPGTAAALAATLVGAHFDPLFGLRPANPDFVATAVLLGLRIVVAAVAATARGAFRRTIAALRHLEELEREREAFVQVLTHELRNPLAALSGYLELAKRYVADPERLGRAPSTLESALGETARLGRLINDLQLLLSMSTPEVGIARASIDLRASALRAIERVYERAGARRLRAELGELPVVVAGDSDRIDQILDNFVKNAVNYSPDGSEIVVIVRSAGSGSAARGIISVKDAGPGVAREERDRIFERFVRGTAGRGAAGSGVGLAVARELARLMGGRVMLEDGPGPGSTFSLELPLAAAEPIGARSGIGEATR